MSLVLVVSLVSGRLSLNRPLFLRLWSDHKRVIDQLWIVKPPDLLGLKRPMSRQLLNRTCETIELYAHVVNFTLDRSNTFDNHGDDVADGGGA